MTMSVPRPLGALAVGMLLLAPAVDELCSAAPTVGAPDLRADLVLSVTALFVFGTVLPVIASMTIEPLALWLSDGAKRRRILLVSGAGWAAGFFATAAAPNPWALAAGISLAFVAGGVALGVARAGLVAGTSDIERALARWTLAGAVGDWLGPLCLAGLAWQGGGWRAAMAACGVSVSAWWLLTARVPLSGEGAEEEEEDEGEDNGGSKIREALARPGLAAWLVGVALCTLLDEIFVAGTALYATDVLKLDLVGAGLLSACEMTGNIVSLTFFERWGAPRRAMIPACLLSLVGLLGAIASPSPIGAGIALFVCGLGVGPQYPLALAAAHRALPGRPGRVEALSQLLVVLDLAFPLVFGAVADRLGLAAALVFLGLQPAGLALLALCFPVREPASESGH